MVRGYLVALACAGSISTRVALGAVALANLAFTLGPTIVSSDVFGYIAYGRELALHGLDPYVSPPLALGHDSILKFVYWKNQPSPYGPLFSFVSVPLGFVSAAVALWAYKLAAGRRKHRDRLHRVLDRPRAWARPGAGGDLRRAQSGLSLLCRERRPQRSAGDLPGRDRPGSGPSRNGGRGAGAAVAGAAIKLTVGLALPFVVLAARRRGRAVRGAAIMTVLLGVPTFLLFGSHVFDQLHRIATDPLFDTLYSGPDRLAAALGTHITPAIRTLCTAAAGLIGLGALVAGWRGADAITAAGWAFLALIASIASFAPWYLVWLLPFAALARSRPLRVATLLVTLYVMAVHIPAFGGVPWLSQAPGSAAATRTVAEVGRSRWVSVDEQARKRLGNLLTRRPVGLEPVTVSS